MVLLGFISNSSLLHSEEATLSGKTHFEGLGDIALPEGKWHIEMNKLGVNIEDNHLPEFIVFRSDKPIIERLTILRYPANTGSKLSHLIDFLGESLGTGVPIDASKVNITGTHSPLKRVPPDMIAREKSDHLEYSFVFDPLDSSPRWLCHCYLFAVDDRAFVVVYSSPAVNTAEVVVDLVSFSRFESK
jgi:hypothetical protein